ncbi:hypothetical protein [Polaromonas sp. CG9_12]|nr:hypothetical protein [Polaromonas sp. CG9_12]
MALNPKRTQRVVTYLNEKEYIDLLKSAARFDKRPGDFVRFGLLRDMYGSLGMDASLHNDNDSADEAQGE